MKNNLLLRFVKMDWSKVNYRNPSRPSLMEDELKRGEGLTVYEARGSKFANGLLAHVL
jgi:hypothetical protein